MALNHLRLRKQLEDLLSKRLGSLGTLESTLISVEASAGDIEVFVSISIPNQLSSGKIIYKIMKSYESSASTLRAILSHPSLQRESIDATLDALAEANANAHEVDEAIRMGGNITVGIEGVIDDDELDAELRGLILEAGVERQAKLDMERMLEDTEIQGRLEGVGMAVPAGHPGQEKAKVAAS